MKNWLKKTKIRHVDFSYANSARIWAVWLIVLCVCVFAFVNGLQKDTCAFNCVNEYSQLTIIIQSVDSVKHLFFANVALRCLFTGEITFWNHQSAHKIITSHFPSDFKRFSRIRIVSSVVSISKANHLKWIMFRLWTILTIVSSLCLLADARRSPRNTKNETATSDEPKLIFAHVVSWIELSEFNSFQLIFTFAWTFCKI